MKKLSLFSFLFALQCHAQSLVPELVSCAGAHDSLPGYSISWSIGECISDTYYASGSVISKGFHQPAAVFLSALPESHDQTSAFFFPNPVAEQLIADLNGMPEGAYELSVFSMDGKLIFAKEFFKNPSEHRMFINLSGLSTGNYVLTMRGADGKFKVFRIHKL